MGIRQSTDFCSEQADVASTVPSSTNRSQPAAMQRAECYQRLEAMITSHTNSVDQAQQDALARTPAVSFEVHQGTNVAIDDITDNKTRKKVRRIMQMLPGSTVRQCYDALRETKYNYDKASRLAVKRSAQLGQPNTSLSLTGADNGTVPALAQRISSTATGYARTVFTATTRSSAGGRQLYVTSNIPSNKSGAGVSVTEAASAREVLTDSGESSIGTSLNGDRASMLPQMQPSAPATDLSALIIVTDRPSNMSSTSVQVSSSSKPTEWNRPLHSNTSALHVPDIRARPKATPVSRLGRVPGSTPTPPQAIAQNATTHPIQVVPIRSTAPPSNLRMAKSSSLASELTPTNDTMRRMPSDDNEDVEQLRLKFDTLSPKSDHYTIEATIQTICDLNRQLEGEESYSSKRMRSGLWRKQCSEGGNPHEVQALEGHEQPERPEDTRDNQITQCDPCKRSQYTSLVQSSR